MVIARRVAITVALAVLLGIAGFATYYFVLAPKGPCMTLGGNGRLRSNLSSSTFGALTEYRLPAPSRLPNAIAVAPDGSVWFGEQSVPGVGHLYVNGTLVEYPWPSAAHPSNNNCGFESSIWGIAAWDGMVWGTNQDQDALVGVNPQSGVTRVINLSGLTTFPYTLSIAPDASLWFTALGNSPVLGRVATDYSVTVIPLTGLGKEFPTQIQFVNTTYAYFVALAPYNNSGGLYSFDPRGPPAAILPQKVGGGFPLASPDSVSYADGIVWVAQHGPSSVAAYDTRSARWTVFPTSRENYTLTTLPYFVSASNGKLWFNEHQGNRIAVIDPAGGTMTEYSESNPPVTNGSAIGNDLTIATASNGLWFTSTTGNYIGFANGAYTPSFSLSLVGKNSASVQSGGQVTLRFTVTGSWKTPLVVQMSDSETYSSVPKAVSIVPSASTIPSGSGQAQFTVQVGVGAGLAAGAYTLDVTVSDGLVLRTVFVFLKAT